MLIVKDTSAAKQTFENFVTDKMPLIGFQWLTVGASKSTETLHSLGVFKTLVDQKRN